MNYSVISKCTWPGFTDRTQIWSGLGDVFRNSRGEFSENGNQDFGLFDITEENQDTNSAHTSAESGCSTCVLYNGAFTSLSQALRHHLNAIELGPQYDPVRARVAADLTHTPVQLIRSCDVLIRPYQKIRERVLNFSGDLYRRPFRATATASLRIHSAAALISSAARLPQASGYSSEFGERHEQNRYRFFRRRK